MRSLFLRFFCLVLIGGFLLPTQVRAQDAGGGGGGGASAEVTEIREAVGIILLSGLVGAVMGLSTLSFYENPQEKIKNITFGAGAGIIASALYLTARVAMTPPQAEKSASYFYPGYDLESGSLKLGFNKNF